MKVISRSKATYTANGETKSVTEIHLFGLTVLVYRKAKNGDKRIRIDHDEFFGTGTTVCMFLPF